MPLAFKGIDLQKNLGIAYAAAGDLMFAASVYNLILPGLTLTSTSINLHEALSVIIGILLGSVFLWVAYQYLSPARLENARWQKLGTKT